MNPEVIGLLAVVRHTTVVFLKLSQKVLPASKVSEKTAIIQKLGRLKRRNICRRSYDYCCKNSVRRLNSAAWMWVKGVRNYILPVGFRDKTALRVLRDDVLKKAAKYFTVLFLN